MKAINETTKKEYQAPRIVMMQMKLESFICWSPDKDTDPDTGDDDWGSDGIVIGGDSESPWPDGGEHWAD